MKYAKGIMWLDDCRIPFVENDIPSGGYGSATITYGNAYEYNGGAGQTKHNGRFTPNLLVCDDMLNDGSVSKSQKTNGVNIGRFPNTIKTGVQYQKEYERGFEDKGTNSRYYDLDLWFDKMLDGL
jgi:hypothetical protein